MLSSASGDAATGPVCTTDGGEPFWQRNVLYYTVRPSNDTCPGGTDGYGYEDMCPHKVLIRKVIDTNPATSPTGNPNDVKEVALGSMTAYLTRPNETDVSAILGEPQVTAVEVVAVNLLTMRVGLAPDANAPGEVLVTYKAFNEPSSRQTTQVGSVALGEHPNTLTYVLSAFPRNTI